MKLKECSEMLKKAEIIFFDFDGVFTDNYVYVASDGAESVRCWRGDGIGLQKIRLLGIPFFIVSTEKNKVVSARAKKLGIPCYQNVADKLIVVKKILTEIGLHKEKAIFVGNDENDITALQYVGIPIIPKDAALSLLSDQAYIKCESDGGRGVVREICEAIYHSKISYAGEGK
jgi:3-deoxy-D-manno-octulosonate 8-phosphate phosphatase (KDO 8-P phosphatase)